MQTSTHTLAFLSSLPLSAWPCGQRGICCSCWCHLEIITRPSVAPGHSKRLRPPSCRMSLRSGNLHLGVGGFLRTEDLAAHKWWALGGWEMRGGIDSIAAGLGYTTSEAVSKWLWVRVRSGSPERERMQSLLARRAPSFYSWGGSTACGRGGDRCLWGQHVRRVGVLGWKGVFCEPPVVQFRFRCLLCTFREMVPQFTHPTNYQRLHVAIHVEHYKKKNLRIFFFLYVCKINIINNKSIYILLISNSFITDVKVIS